MGSWECSTLVTLVMFPILVATYVRLAHREEREAAAAFGKAWQRYADVTPRWIPRLGGRHGSRGDSIEAERTSADPETHHRADGTTAP